MRIHRSAVFAMTQRLEAIGYWFNDLAPSAYPRPQLLLGKWRARERSRVVAYLRGGSTFESYRSGTFCRFACGIPSSALGRRDLTDGVWVWPEGLAHYVETHSVRLPDRFVRHALSERRQLPVRFPHREGLIDDASWITWGREQGASLDLSSWQVPSERDRRTIDRQLAKHVPWKRRVILLARAETREVVLALSQGRLAIVSLGTEPAIRILAGWDAWPGDVTANPG
jgi:hypothetical protein